MLTLVYFTSLKTDVCRSLAVIGQGAVTEMEAQ